MDYSKLDFIRVAAVSSEVKVADVDFNCDKIIESLEILSKKNISIICFQELTLTTYTCGDIFFNNTLISASKDALIKLKEFSKNIQSAFIIGLPLIVNNELFNTAALIHNGSIKGIAVKSHLPNYNEFYEKRWFSQANDMSVSETFIDGQLVPIGNNLVFSNRQVKFGIEICEDLWVTNPVSNELTAGNSEIIFNLSASNELLFKKSYRESLVLNQSARTNSAYVYSGANPSESSTDITFSGHLLIAENGTKKVESRKFQFETDFIIADIDLGKIRSNRLRLKDSSVINNSITHINIEPFALELPSLIDKPKSDPFIPNDVADKKEVCDEILNIQSTALAKRLKHIGISNITIGVSGGLDSTLALIVCVMAFEKLGLEKQGIHSLVMPGPGSSKQTQLNAKDLSTLFKTSYKEISIIKAVENHLNDINHSNHNYDITYENAQARERTQILMDYANKVGGICIGTGDLSELALGWCTYNADQVSMYGVNSGVPKTLVKFIIEYYASTIKNNVLSKLLNQIISQPISPELLPASKDGSISQLTESKIGPYILNDFFLFYFLRYNFSATKVFHLATIAFENQFSKQVILKWFENFITKFFNSQFKRSLMPDGIKVGSVAVSPRADLRMPSDASSSIWKNEIKKLKESFK